MSSNEERETYQNIIVAKIFRNTKFLKKKVKTEYFKHVFPVSALLRKIYIHPIENVTS
jgi:hypothetical protein